MIPIKDFIGEYKSMEKEIDEAIKRVLLSGNYILGPEVKAFEEEFAKATGNRFCIGCASGTDAITLSALVLGIGASSEIITSNFTAFPTIVGIERCGAKAILVDCKEEALIDPKKIEEKITKKTKAIVPVHLFNLYCDMKEIMKIAKNFNLKVVEDCAQRTFTRIVGDCGAYSFYPTKTLGCYGDGGAVCTNDRQTYKRLLALRNYGQTKKNEFTYKGLNSRLDEIQAAILRVKLRHKDRLKGGEEIRFSKKREVEMAYFKTIGMETIIHYPYTVSNQKSFQGQKKEKFPISEEISKTIFSIPAKKT